jgi:capsular exopolysaccharide synthesis family protein
MDQRDDFGFEPQEFLQGGQSSRSLLKVVWHRKALVALGAVVGLVLGILFYAQQTPIYQATAQVMVIKKRGDPMPIVGGDPRMMYMEDYVASHLIVIRSPLIIERAVGRRNLRSLPSLAGKEAIGTISASLTASRDSKGSDSGPNNVINLSYRGTVPEDCKEVLTAIIEGYKNFLDEAYHNVSDENVNLLTHRKNVLKREVDDLQAKYDTFRNQNQNLVFKGADGLNSQRKRALELEDELTKLVARKTKIDAALKAVDAALKANKSRDAVLALVATPSESKKPSPEHLALLDKLFLLRLEEKKLRDSEGFGPGHPSMKAVRSQIEEGERLLKEAAEARSKTASQWAEIADRAFQDPLDRFVKLQSLELKKIESEEESLRRQLQDTKEEAVKLDLVERQETTHRLALAKTTQEYDDLVKRLNEINRVRDAGGFDAQILSKPGHGYKVAPNAFQILFGGLLLGILAGVGLAYLAETSDRSFRTPEEIRRRLGLPVVGHIPQFAADEEASGKIKAGHVVPDPYLCSHYRPKSIEAEAYRAVRTALFFSTQGEGHKVIQVTSPDQGDGKSTLASNLAVSIAQSGKRVLLVDADCRRPRQHKVFGVSAAAGLACVMAGTTDSNSAILPTAVDGLHLLPAGPIPPNPAELLTSPRFKDFLDEQRQRYDFVLVDTPPLLAVTDPSVVAARVDGVLMTIRMSRKGRPSAERAKEVLTTLGAKILGVVVNGVDAAGGSYSAYSYAQDYEADDSPTTPTPARHGVVSGDTPSAGS